MYDVFYIYEFDKLKEYTNYFPHNNFSNVCKEKKVKYNRKQFNKRMGNSARSLMKSNASSINN